MSRIYTPEKQTQLDALIAKRDAESDALNAYYDDADGEEDEGLCERLEEAATAASDAVDNFAERLETFDPEEMKLAGAFITIDTDGELVIERGLVKRADMTKLASEAGPASVPPVADAKKVKPLHGEKLCRRLTAHRTAAVQAELARRPVVALAALMNRLIPTVFQEHYLRSYVESAVKIDAHTSRDALVRDADDMESSVAFTQIEADRLKWVKLLPKNVDDLLPWLLKQETDTMASLFAFCVAATLDGVSATESAQCSPDQRAGRCDADRHGGLLEANPAKLPEPCVQGADHRRGDGGGFTGIGGGTARHEEGRRSGCC